MECVISCGVLALAGRSFLFDRPGRVTVQCHRCDYPRAEVRYVVGSVLLTRRSADAVDFVLFLSSVVFHRSPPGPALQSR
jgi:hypothetical protein